LSKNGFYLKARGRDVPVAASFFPFYLGQYISPQKQILNKKLVVSSFPNTIAKSVILQPIWPKLSSYLAKTFQKKAIKIPSDFRGLNQSGYNFGLFRDNRDYLPKIGLNPKKMTSILGLESYFSASPIV